MSRLMSRFRYWFFEKFGERYQGQIYVWHGNRMERRGWIWMGKTYWYDEEWS